ncbi:MAG: hypothetical protein K5636_03365 [Bacteroidales bacterium]|nr:hypothetical protein [Bacteroidales bacterium]
MENNDKYNSFSLMSFIWKKRKVLLIICIAAMVVSLVCSLLIKSKYKSTAVIYAPRTNSFAKILLNEENYNERLDIKAYASEEETEQMMQLLEAREIKDSLIQKFNLTKHLDIDTNLRGWRTKIMKNLNNAIEIKRTNYGAISITVKDTDPKMACQMTEEILKLVDTIKNRTEHARAKAAYVALCQQLDSIDKEVARVDDSIKICMQNGVFNLEVQSERVMQQYAIAVSQGNAAAVSRLAKEQEKLAVWGPRLDALQNMQKDFLKYQSLCKQKLLDARLDMEGSMPVKFVVERPIVADKKFYPKRSLIVIVSTLSVLILSVFVLLMIDKIEDRSFQKDTGSAE